MGLNNRVVRVVLGASAALWAVSLSTAQADVHTAGVPLLASRPGAAYTLYLNYNGFNFAGAWGGNSATNTTGSFLSIDRVAAAGTFTATQQNNIRRLWSRTAEKFVGFDINVTTIDPAVAAGQAATDAQRQAFYDTRARTMHAIVSGSVLNDNAFVGNRGGVSYTGVAQNTYATAAFNGGAGRGFHTNFSFSTTTTGTRYPAEIATHELGHALRLNHQTSTSADYSSNGGSSAHAPIMGNSYSSARGTWRTGQTNYAGTTIQNDVVQLLGNSGMGYVDDGVGHTMATATALPLTGTGSVIAAAAGGWINPVGAAPVALDPTPLDASNYTTDFFRFSTAGGAFNLTINESGQLVTAGVADGGGTLDSILNLLDAAGNVLQSATNAASQTSTISRALAAGDYFVQVLSAGGKASTANPAEVATYFDMGSYFLTGSVVVPEPAMFVAMAGAWAVVLRRRRRAVA